MERSPSLADSRQPYPQPKDGLSRAEDVETHERVLELLVWWDTHTLLEAHHLAFDQAFVLATSEAARDPACVRFVVDGHELTEGVMPLLNPRGELVFSAETRGFVHAEGQLWSLAQLSASCRATPHPEREGSFCFVLPRGASAELELAGLTFTLREVAAAKRVGAGAPKLDSRTLFWTGASVALHGLLLLSMWLLPPKGSALSLSRLDDDVRQMRYLLHARQEAPPETPAWSDPKRDAGGSGKAHAGDEGQAGKADAARTRRRYAIAGDSRDVRLARSELEHEAHTGGILGVLNRAAMNQGPSSPFGSDTPLGYDPMTTIGAIMGEQVGENFGFGGIGMRGTGRGGGGDGQGTIGLDKVGTVGHGAGGGSGAGYGRGTGALGRREARVPQIRVREAEVRGSLAKEVIRRAIQRRLSEIRYCYEQGLGDNPELAGRVQVKFVIAPSGSVQGAAVESSSLQSARVESCITDAVRRFSFPAPDGGGVVIVSYPFLLERS